MVVGTFFIYV